MKQIDLQLIQEGFIDLGADSLEERRRNFEDIYGESHRLFCLEEEEDEINQLVKERKHRLCKECSKYQTPNCDLIPFPNICYRASLKITRKDSFFGENKKRLVKIEDNKIKIGHLYKDIRWERE